MHMPKISIVALLWAALLCLNGCGSGTGDSAAQTSAEQVAAADSDSSEAAADADAVYEDTQELMGTVITVRAFGSHAKEGVEAAFSRAAELEQVFSNTISDSEVCKGESGGKGCCRHGNSGF